MPDKKDYSFTGVESPSILQEEFIEPSTIETVDRALVGWLEQEMKIFSTTSKGWKKVPVIWASAERAYQIKHSKELRDSDGTLILPLISVERLSVTKDLGKKGVFFGAPGLDMGHQHGGRITIARRIVQDKTADVANANSKRKNTDSGNKQINFPSMNKNKQVIYETISVPMPVYLDMVYSIVLRTEYQQQMNEMLTPFATLGGHINSFTIGHDGHRYEVFVDSNFAQNNNISNMTEEERQYTTTINVRVLGYLMGEGLNQERPKIIKKQNAVKVKIPREHVIVGDISDHIDKRGFYKE